MIKKILSHILILVMLAMIFAPVYVSAQTTGGGSGGSQECGWFSNWGVCFANALGDIFASILYLILTIISYILYIAGLLLDYVLRYTIIDLKLNLQQLTGINIAWKVIKDLMNLAFIFILIYKGIELIIGAGSKESIKNFISALVIAALLVNFSLFFTKVLIDASNIVTLGFYKTIVESAGTPIPVRGPTGEYTLQMSGISVPFMKNLGLSTFWDRGSFDSVRNQTGGNWNMVIIPLLGIFLFLITAMVFVAVAFIFVIRYIVLIILLILSPIAYMGSALPFLGKYSKDWWEALSGQLLFGPLYMIMTWIVLTLMGSAGFVTGNSVQWGQLVSGAQVAANVPYQQSPISLVFNFAILIGLIIASLIVSKKYASQGSTQLAKITGSASSMAGSALFGSSAAMLRNTLGRAALSGTTAEDLEVKAAAGDKGARARLSLAKGSYDVRRSRVGEALASASGVSTGKGLPFNDKTGEGGQAGTTKRKEQESEKEIDVVMKAYRSKPSELARYVSGRNDADQKYVYDKLSARDRAALDDELDKLQFGSTITPAQRGKNTITAKLRSGLSTDEKEKTIKASADASKDKKGRDKVSLLKALSISGIIQRATAAGVPVPVDPSTGLPYVMPDDPSTNAPYPLIINNPRTGVPYTYSDQELKLTPNEARKLSPESRRDPGVIQKMTPKHLKDLIDSGEMEDSETEDIVRTILGLPAGAAIPNPVPPRAGPWLWTYANQQAQFNYITKPEIAPLFGINV